MERSLQDIANKAKENIENTVEEVVDVPENNDFVIHGIDNNPTIEIDLSEDDIGTDDLSPESNFEITDEMLKETMPDIDPSMFSVKSSELRSDLEVYRKNLIIAHGLTVEEANNATNNRMKKEGNTINNKYLEDNPKVGIIEINKVDADKLELTKEEREKLIPVKSIKMVLVEDAELKHIKVEKVNKEHKANYLRSIEGSLSKYSVPLTIMGDFVTFTGAQLIQLASAMRHEDDSLVEEINKKASLIYSKISDGSIFNKYDGDRNTVMTYSEFTNKFNFDDIDMALYGIIIASSMEESETNLICSSCKSEFQWKYRLRTLLNADNTSEKFKERINNIIKGKFNKTELLPLHDELNKEFRIKSPFTENIYSISYPSIARAINVFSSINEEDITESYISTLALYCSGVYIYNQDTESYFHVSDEDDDDLELLFDTLKMIPQSDIEVLTNYLQDFIYTAEFALKTKCPKCAHEMSNTLNIDEMVFLRARDSYMEIK